MVISRKMEATPIHRLRSEESRLATFTTWPHTFITREDMARYGVCYLFVEDMVQCVFCGVIIGDFEDGDSALEDHVRWSPLCPFLRGYNTGNIPIGATPSRIPVENTSSPEIVELQPKPVNILRRRRSIITHNVRKSELKF